MLVIIRLEHISLFCKTLTIRHTEKKTFFTVGNRVPVWV